MVLQNTVELQENVSESQLRIANSDDMLSIVGHPRQHNRQSSQKRVMTPLEEEPDNMRQPISAGTGQNTVPTVRPPHVHECLSHLPDLRDHNRAREKEQYMYNYEPPVPCSATLTPSIAPPCFAHEVISHPFPRPFIVRNVDKYSSDSKSNHWITDYLT